MSRDHDTGALSGAVETARLSDVDRLKKSLEPLPVPDSPPALIVLSGLPGSGKSYFCRRLARLLPTLVTLETDALRFALVDEPTHSDAENARIYGALHRLIERLLKDGHILGIDATNLIRRNRRRLYRIAEEAGARIIIVALSAPDSVVRERLSYREDAIILNRQTEDHSAAGNEVYDRMSRTAQPIQRDHIRVDSSQDITPHLREVMARLHRTEIP